MLRLYKERGGSKEQIAYLMPGDADCYGEAAQDLSRLILFGCFDSDLGGEVRLVDRQHYVSTPNHSSVTDDFLEKTKLIRSIGFCEETRFALNEEVEGAGYLVIEHIPGHFN